MRNYVRELYVFITILLTHGKNGFAEIIIKNLDTENNFVGY